MLRVHMLGRMGVSYQGESLRLPPRSMVPSLWAYLLIHADSPEPRSHIAFRFWPDSPESTARARLRRALHRLVQLLPELPGDERWVLSDHHSIRWNPAAPFWLDVAEFTRLSQSENSLDAAATLYRGDLLEDLYDDWVFPERERLRQVYFQVLTRLIAQRQEESDMSAALDYAQRLLQHDPLREATYRELMRLNAELGDRASLVRTFDTCRGVLADELGVEPARETITLYRRLLAQEEPAPRRTAKGREILHNRPAEMTSFIGRESDVESVAKLLQTNRLLTLAGMGGVGKTRLAAAAAAKVQQGFTAGGWWVDLGPIADSSLVPQVIATSLGMREPSERPTLEAMIDGLRGKRILVVLDNCEHLIDASARIVHRLLGELPKLTILATSTGPLGVPGETVWRVTPLDLPPDPARVADRSSLRDEIQASESACLFLERALSTLPTFVLTPANAPDLARVCRALDGIPLALELAAAQLRVLSLSDLAERLEDRFGLLASGPRTDVPRHQTLRATLDWSHELLAPKEQVLFRRLAAFSGSFSLPALEFVAGDDDLGKPNVLQLLSRLVDKSLVTVVRTASGGVRYRLLETVAQYAQEKLRQSAEWAAVNGRFVAYMVQIAQDAGPNMLRGGEQKSWYTLLESEIDNFRTAMRWAQDAGDAESLARAAAGLWPFWWTHGYSEEASVWLNAASAEQDVLGPRLRSEVLTAMGRLAILQGYAAAGRELLLENLDICQNLDDGQALADAASNLGIAASYLGDLDQAVEWYERSLAEYRELDDAWGVARSLNNLGDLNMTRQNFAEATVHLEEARRIFHGRNEVFGESVVLINLGRTALHEDQPEVARNYFHKSLKQKMEMQDREGVAWNLEGLAAVAAILGRSERAARLYGAADALRRQIGVPVSTPDRPFYERYLEAARLQIPPETWGKRWAEGEQLGIEAAVQLALDSG